MNRIRHHLADTLRRKIERHGVVIWDDPESAYREAVEDVTPLDTTLRVFDGSWYALRYNVEPLLDGLVPPPLLVYLPTKKPGKFDPLEELRAIGTSYSVRLPTLLRQGLRGHLTEKRISRLGEQCSTLSQAEAALEGGAGEVDARIVAVIGATSPPVVAGTLIAGNHRHALTEQALDSAVRNTLTESLGGDFGSREGDSLREAAFRHVVLTALQNRLGRLPEGLALTVTPGTPAQQTVCIETLQAMQQRPELHHCYIALAKKTDSMLQLSTTIRWDSSLAELDTTPAIESLAFQAALLHVQRGEFAEAADLAGARLDHSWWAKSTSPGNQEFATRWRALKALADLGGELKKPLPSPASLEETTDWYTNDGWKVDSLYRQAELLSVASGIGLEELDDLFQDFRSQYRQWLSAVLHIATDALRDVHIGSATLQRSIHQNYVAKFSDRCAYILVDALRYELGRDLAARLTSLRARIATDAAISTPPTITRVGMAALQPGSDTSFRVALDGSSRLKVIVGKDAVRNVKDRLRCLEHAHGKVSDLTLDKVAQSTSKTLNKRTANADLVLVRSTEIDRGGEADQLSASWTIFDSTLNILQTAVAKLLSAGIQRIVITADHGFVAVRQLGGEAKIDPPATGTGELHRRVWIGRGGTATDSTFKIPLADFGITGDLDIITPRGLGVFKAGGGLQFFHGGLSPQELIVPVIVVSAEDPPDEQTATVSLELAGGRITTGVFAAKLTMAGDLFNQRTQVRLQLIQNRRQVATVVGGDGVDSATKTIETVAGPPHVITMQVTANLQAGSTASLEALAAETGMRLGVLQVEVGTNVVLADRLD